MSKQESKNAVPPPTNVDCRICLEDIVHEVAELDSCSHIFHPDCIKAWAQINNTCPLCKQRFHEIGWAPSAGSTRSFRKRKIAVSDTEQQAPEYSDSDSGEEGTGEHDERCQICSSPEDTSIFLLCDVCNKAYHMACLRPPLTEVPEGDWFCDTCRGAQERALSRLFPGTRLGELSGPARNYRPQARPNAGHLHHHHQRPEDPLPSLQEETHPQRGHTQPTRGSRETETETAPEGGRERFRRLRRVLQAKDDAEEPEARMETQLGGILGMEMQQDMTPVRHEPAMRRDQRPASPSSSGSEYLPEENEEERGAETDLQFGNARPAAEGHASGEIDMKNRPDRRGPRRASEVSDLATQGGEDRKGDESKEGEDEGERAKVVAKTTIPVTQDPMPALEMVNESSQKPSLSQASVPKVASKVPRSQAAAPRPDVIDVTPAAQPKPSPPDRSAPSPQPSSKREASAFYARGRERQDARPSHDGERRRRRSVLDLTAAADGKDGLSSSRSLDVRGVEMQRTQQARRKALEVIQRAQAEEAQLRRERKSQRRRRRAAERKRDTQPSQAVNGSSSSTLSSRSGREAAVGIDPETTVKVNRSTYRLVIYSGEVVSHRSAQFQAHAAIITARADVTYVMSALRQQRGMATASCFSMAYRVKEAGQGRDGRNLGGAASIARGRAALAAIVEGHSNDTAQRTGKKLASVLRLAQAVNMVVVVTQWLSYPIVISSQGRNAKASQQAHILLRDLERKGLTQTANTSSFGDAALLFHKRVTTHIPRSTRISLALRAFESVGGSRNKAPTEKVANTSNARINRKNVVIRRRAAGGRAPNAAASALSSSSIKPPLSGFASAYGTPRIVARRKRSAKTSGGGGRSGVQKWARGTAAPSSSSSASTVIVQSSYKAPVSASRRRFAAKGTAPATTDNTNKKRETKRPRTSAGFNSPSPALLRAAAKVAKAARYRKLSSVNASLRKGATLSVGSVRNPKSLDGEVKGNLRARKKLPSSSSAASSSSRFNFPPPSSSSLSSNPSGGAAGNSKRALQPTSSSSSLLSPAKRRALEILRMEANRLTKPVRSVWRPRRNGVNELDEVLESVKQSGGGGHKEGSDEGNPTPDAEKLGDRGRGNSAPPRASAKGHPEPKHEPPSIDHRRSSGDTGSTFNLNPIANHGHNANAPSKRSHSDDLPLLVRGKRPREDARDGGGATSRAKLRNRHVEEKTRDVQVRGNGADGQRTAHGEEGGAKRGRRFNGGAKHPVIRAISHFVKRRLNELDPALRAKSKQKFSNVARAVTDKLQARYKNKHGDQEIFLTKFLEHHRKYIVDYLKFTMERHRNC